MFIIYGVGHCIKPTPPNPSTPLASPAFKAGSSSTDPSSRIKRHRNLPRCSCLLLRLFMLVPPCVDKRYFTGMWLRRYEHCLFHPPQSTWKRKHLLMQFQNCVPFTHLNWNEHQASQHTSLERSLPLNPCTKFTRYVFFPLLSQGRARSNSGRGRQWRGCSWI